MSGMRRTVDSNQEAAGEHALASILDYSVDVPRHKNWKQRQLSWIHSVAITLQLVSMNDASTSFQKSLCLHGIVQCSRHVSHCELVSQKVTVSLFISNDSKEGHVTEPTVP